MEIGLVEIIVGLIGIGIGWLHVRQGNLEKRLDGKTNQDDFNELKADVRSISDHVVELKVDQTRCLTILEGMEKNNSKSA